MLTVKSTGREAVKAASLINFLCMGEEEKSISAKPLFERFDAEKGAAAKLAKRLNISQGRIANWRTRGIPAAMVPEVAAYLGLKTDEYLVKVGRVRAGELIQEPPAEYTSSDSPQITRLIKAFAWLMDDEQEKLLRELEAKATANKAIAKQMGPRFSYATDETMLALLRRGGDFPPGSKKKSSKAKSQRKGSFREDDPE